MNRNLKNIISLFSIEFIARLLGLLAVTYLARVLGKSNFGIINIGLAVLSYAMIIGNGGLTLLGTRKVAGNVNNIEKLSGDILLTRITFAALIFIISAAAVYYLVHSEEVAHTTIAYLFFLFPNAILLEWFFQGKQKMEMIAIGRIIGSLTYLIFVVLFVVHAHDTVLTGVGWVVGGLINALFLIVIFLITKNKINFNYTNFNLLTLFKESYSLGIASIIAQFVILFPIIYLGYISSNSDAGIYSAAYKIIIIFLIVDRVFSALFFPKITQYYAANPENLKMMFNKILKIVSVFGLCVSLLAFVGGEIIVRLIFGNQYLEAVNVFQIMIISFFFTLLSSVFSFTFIGIHKEKIYTKSLIIGVGIFLLSLIIFTKYYGIKGAAFSYSLFELTVFGIMAFDLNKIFRINFVSTVLIPACAAIAFVVLIMTFFNASILIQVLISVILGLPLIAFAGRIKIDDVNFIKRIFV